MLHPERKAQRALQRLVGAAGAPVEVIDKLEGAAIDDTTIVIADAAMATSLTRPAARAWIAVPGEGVAPADAATISSLLAAGWEHVITHPMPLLAEELLATVQKLLRRDTFGLEKYLTWSADVRTYTLDDAQDREAVVSELAREVISMGLPDRVGSLVSVIADELLANALYAAPVDDAGNHVRAGDPRDRVRALSGRDVVTLRWATDGRCVAIEVRDRYGSIEPAAIARRLMQSQSSEGGMGLPLAYACCNQFVLNVAPGKLTEVVALLDVRFKPTDLSRTASFHAFTGEAP